MAPATKKQRLSSGHAVEIAENVADNATPATTEKKESKDAEHKRSLFVRSLPPTATSESLTALFSDSYPVKHAVAINDPATKQCRGYGFVTFADAEDAQRAKAEFNGHVIDGNTVRARRLPSTRRRRRSRRSRRDSRLS
jgi:nucleolar protein 4